MPKREKCAKCNMDFQGFHICLEISEAEKKKTELKGYRSYPRAKSDYTSSEEHLENLAQARDAHNQAQKLLNAPRDQNIIEDYKAGGIGIRPLAEKYGTSHSTVLKVLHDAGVPMRKRGRTVKTGA